MLLYINSCVRGEASRTDRLARALLACLQQPVEEVNLQKENLQPLTAQTLEKRTALLEEGKLDDASFALARQFAKAEEIVIAAPYWDLSFPAELKTYLENIYVTGIVSRYGADGIPVGLCKAKKLYYVTTAGGPYNPAYSYAYVREMALQCFGIGDTELLFAQNLDLDGVDADAIVDKAIRDLQARFA